MSLEPSTYARRSASVSRGGVLARGGHSLTRIDRVGKAALRLLRHASITEVNVGVRTILTLSLDGSVEERIVKVFGYCLFATVEYHISSYDMGVTKWATL